MSKKEPRNENQQLSPMRRYGLVGGLLLVVILIAAGLAIFRPAGTPEGETNTPATEAPIAEVLATEAPTYPNEISVAEAAEKRDQGAFILDVREPDEWRQVHIPGATLIPLRELAERSGEIPQDQEIVVVCRSGNRSAKGRDILREVGFTQVTSMAGGMMEWQSQGYPTASGD